MTDLDAARRQEIRFQALSLLDVERFDWVDSAVLLRGMKVPTSPDDLQRELTYLESRQLLRLRKQGDRVQAQLLVAGVDLLEGHTPALAGLIVHEPLSPAEVHRREVLRWILLRLADRSRPIPLQEALAQRALHDVSYVVSEKELRQLTTYLEQKGMLTVDRQANQWQFTPTADGVDVCEYAIECPVGICRPEKF